MGTVCSPSEFQFGIYTEENKNRCKIQNNNDFSLTIQEEYKSATRGPSCNIKTFFKASSWRNSDNPNEMFHIN